MNQIDQVIKPDTDDQDYRKLWVTAVEQMLENCALKERIEHLEREITVNTFAGWSVH